MKIEKLFNQHEGEVNNDKSNGKVNVAHYARSEILRICICASGMNNNLISMHLFLLC